MKLERGTDADQRWAIKTVTFDGTSNTGAVGAVPLFTVTGTILIASLIPVCTNSLTEGGATAELELGITTDTNFFIAQTQPIDIDENEIWFDASPDLTVEALPTGLKDIVLNGATNDILATVVTDTVETGVITFSLRWQPVSSDGLVVPA